MLAKFDDVGLKALAWGEQGFRHITNNRNAIEAPDDVSGLKLRTMENPTHITAFETLGAAPTPMAWPEVISALQQGTIDGQENPLAQIWGSKLQACAPTAMPFGFTSTSLVTASGNIRL